MEDYLYHLDVNELKGKDGLSKTKTFEFLCKEILEQKYNFSEKFIIGKTDSWVECPAIRDSDWRYHTFQAKFSKNSTPLLVDSFFSTKTSIKNLENKNKNTLKTKIKDNNLDILHIFYLWGVEDNSKQVIEKKLKLFYPSLIIKRYKSEVINELLRNNKYIHIVQAYFPKNEILKAIHTQDKIATENVNQDMIYEEINKSWDMNRVVLTSCFMWKYIEKDIDLASSCYEKYLLTKYSFITTPSFGYFEKIESFIEKDKFEDLRQHTEYDDLNFFGVLKSFTDELSKIPQTRSEKISLDLLIDETEPRKWILINSAVHKKCNFIFKNKNKVLFNIIKDVD